MVKQFGLNVFLVLLIFVSALCTRTVIYVTEAQNDKKQSAGAQAVSGSTSQLSIDVGQAQRHLAEALRFKTISHFQPAQRDYQPFIDFQLWFAQRYPRLHQQLARTVIADHTMLFHWQGQSSEQSALISAHYDVVPTPNAQQWQYPPFSGQIADGYIWGRGALDNKGAVIAIAEAIELALAQGIVPQHDLYIAFTHDEEIGSLDGAQGVSQYFTEREIALAWSLDEGSFVFTGMFPGVDEAVASINLSEKGYLNVTLTAHAEAGHSSIPPQATAVDILASALVNIRHMPMDNNIDELTNAMFKQLAPYMSFDKQLVFANQWLFGGLLENRLAANPITNALTNTTVAPTMLSGSIKPNVLPQTAEAVINLRIHPKQTVAQVVEHLSTAINDKRVSVNVMREMEASKVADYQSKSFKLLAKTTRTVFDNPVVIPGLTVAATDSRYYSQVAQNSYRFNPILLSKKELAGFHGLNERISTDNLHKSIMFYYTIFNQ
ncbi:M20/M25/M40 family metallo-hydrolase [Thalassotalea euphylliae]|uniref:M20/M25/M40 family metallo-hydrolase n=1 Tax=Thalassotalea euphylliae TaxID=1655234 RepID=A0A3E0TZF3_9GAMM|nr:M20/M25/M40 family metallo-hydrolase [Thalassotalea euphylliae]REL26267.1 M20/M25/M40 family metallo-hydrolase [Thalassotalea euphylliae]REL30071.1 M20/M25/M40 family metallo-hydrolase [Thalassotalea euphylliae]